MGLFISLLALLLALFSMMASADGRVLLFRWNVKKDLSKITINGYSPGPTIWGQQGDMVGVQVTNLLKEKLAIDWNGIRQQIGDPRSGETLILPGRTFTYRFTLYQAGSFLYYSRFITQKVAGLYGWIQVLLSDSVPEPFAYDYEQSVILNDWFNKSTNDQAFYWDGEPASPLLQGKGKCNSSKSATRSLDTTANNVTNHAYSWTVIPGKTYRLRISSVAIQYPLSFQIEGHNLTVVEADGNYVEPFVVQSLFIYTGETYSVSIKADQDLLRNYWIVTNIVGWNAGATTPPGLNVFNYYPNHPMRVPPTDPPAGPIWNVAWQLAQSLEIKARRGYVRTPPPKADRVIVLLISQNKTYLTASKENLHHVFSQHALPDWLTGFADYDTYRVANDSNATSSVVICRLKFNTTVDIILQNSNTLTANNRRTLSWHLRDHHFWVLGYGIGKFDLDNDPKKYNLVNPMIKNTVALHSNGWTAVRFVADNPGVWAFFCQVWSHFHRGMGVVFQVDARKVGKLSP